MYKCDPFLNLINLKTHLGSASFKGAFSVIFLAGLFVTLPGSLSSPEPAVAKTSEFAVLEKFAGRFKGRGKLRRGSSAKTEPVRCKINNQWNAGAKSLSLSYVCLGLDVRFESRGNLRFSKGSKKISGSWHAAGRNSTVRGSLRGSSLVLSLSGTDPKTGKPTRASLSIVLSGGRSLSSRLSAKDPETGKRFQAFSGSFRK